MTLNSKQLLSLSLLIPATMSAAAKSDTRPNILVIMVDDMGFSDTGCMGGEIDTPNINSLAENGLRFTHFYNAGRSCPTRASLLTGLYSHKAGVGRMAKDGGTEGYEGSIKQEAATIAEVLSDAGYNTGMVGKWHVSATAEIEDHDKWLSNIMHNDQYIPEGTHPLDRGFKDFYGVLWGVVNYFNPFSLTDGRTPVTEFADDYYITDDLTRKAVEYIDKYSKDDKPFFLYLAHVAPHWPLHATEEMIEKYEDTYTVGWEEIRNARYKKMEELGIFEGYSNILSARQFKDAWSDNPTKEWDARAMATHAAMLDRVDQGIGEVLERLEKSGELDNTLIFFLSDNGCSNETPQNYSPGHDDRPSMLSDGSPIYYPKKKEVLPGPANTMTGLGPKWANVANTPFRMWKAKMFEGGTATSMIAYWGDHIKAEKGSIIRSSGHVTDIMATCIDLAKTKYPKKNNGLKTPEIDGVSLRPIFESGERKDRDLFFEHFKGCAIHAADGWKAVKADEKSKWELYNLNVDPTEMVNLANSNTAKLNELIERYDAWAESSLVYPYPTK
ncbi:MAG: arylsulfatase [Rikenellaceae bacterium]